MKEKECKDLNSIENQSFAMPRLITVFLRSGLNFRLEGNWNLSTLHLIELPILGDTCPNISQVVPVDASDLAALDSAGAEVIRLLLKLYRKAGLVLALVELREEHKNLLAFLDGLGQFSDKSNEKTGSVSSVINEKSISNSENQDASLTNSFLSNDLFIDPGISANGHRIGKEQIHAIVGARRSGKSCVASAIRNDTEGFPNHATLNRQTSRWQRVYESRIARVTENDSLSAASTILENVLRPLQMIGDYPAPILKAIAESKLAMVGFPKDLIHVPPRLLSDTALHLAILARTLTLEPALLIIEHPSWLHRDNDRTRLKDMLNVLCERLKMTVLIESSHAARLESFADNYLIVANKEIIASGSHAAMRNHPERYVSSLFCGSPAYNL